MTVIDNVSEAKAKEKALAKFSPDFIRGISVSKYPKKKARTIAKKIVVKLENPKDVPITIPKISPIAQPVRQWRVALKAVFVRFCADIC